MVFIVKPEQFQCEVEAEDSPQVLLDMVAEHLEISAAADIELLAWDQVGHAGVKLDLTAESLGHAGVKDVRNALPCEQLLICEPLLPGRSDRSTWQQRPHNSGHHGRSAGGRVHYAAAVTDVAGQVQDAPAADDLLSG